MRVAIIVGEASGDLLGAQLMSGLEAEFGGIGGAAMAQKGLRSLFPMEELSLMGVAEVLPRIPHLFKRINEAANFVINGEFDVLITIDSPDFCHRVARRVKRACPNIPVIHYVAPSVWAWRPKRAQKMAAHVDHVLCLLPFEPALMQAAGMSADFVGHPVSRAAQPSTASIKAWRAKYGRVLALFPGSRRSEINNHIDVYANMWRNLTNDFPDFSLQIPTLDYLRPMVEVAFDGLPSVHIFSSKDDSFEQFQQSKTLLMHGAQLAVATSGTVSFELAWAGCPTIVGYKTNALNSWIAKRFVKLDYASLANILLKREVIPEFLFDKFMADALKDTVCQALGSREFAKNQRAAFDEMRKMMSPKVDASEAVGLFLEGSRGIVKP